MFPQRQPVPQVPQQAYAGQPTAGSNESIWPGQPISATAASAGQTGGVFSLSGQIYGGPSMVWTNIRKLSFQFDSLFLFTDASGRTNVQSTSGSASKYVSKAISWSPIYARLPTNALSRNDCFRS